MNERIKQLAIEAGLIEGVFTRHDGVSCDLKGYSMLPDQLKKFAELIVGECLDQCYNRGMNDELYAGQLKAASFIEQHFGVEE